MAVNDLLTLAALAIAIILIVPFLGRYIHRVMEGERVILSPIVRPVERLVYRIIGVDETVEQTWKGYAVSVLAMAAVAIVAGYVMLRLQDVLPLNQGGIPPVSPDLAFNTSVSFETNTNWQNYSGETGATYLTQAAMLAVRNFTSAATGLAIAIALFRGLTRRSTKTLGNYWVDLTRGILYILLPISIIGALVLVSQGVPQTWDPSRTVTTLQGVQQTIAIGPVASQEWIKELGPRPAAGLDDLRRDGRDPPCGGRLRHAHRGDGQPALPTDGRPGLHGQHGGQGDPVRCGIRRPVHGGDDWHQHGRHQLLA